MFRVTRWRFLSVFRVISQKCMNICVQGDQMEILDDTDPDWWVSRHLGTGETGHIPRNYVALQSSIESEE